MPEMSPILSRIAHPLESEECCEPPTFQSTVIEVSVMSHFISVGYKRIRQGSKPAWRTRGDFQEVRTRTPQNFSKQKCHKLYSGPECWPDV